jgi:rRNA maturation RNase YbeY
MLTQINFYEINEFVQFKSVFNEILIWTIKKIDLKVKSLDVVLTNNSEVRKLHNDFFNLDSNTDVITFNLRESLDDEIEGEIYISVDQAAEQSIQYQVNNVPLEICRLIVHGCLHLAGYSDKYEPQLTEMKSKEDQLVEEIKHFFNKKLKVKETKG